MVQLDQTTPVAFVFFSALGLDPGHLDSMSVLDYILLTALRAERFEVKLELLLHLRELRRAWCRRVGAQVLLRERGHQLAGIPRIIIIGATESQWLRRAPRDWLAALLLLATTGTRYPLLQDLRALQAGGDIVEAVLVSIRQVRLLGASAAPAHDLVYVLRVLSQVTILLVQLEQAKRVELFVKLVHVLLQLVDVAIRARVHRELGLVHFVARVLVLWASNSRIRLVILGLLDESEAVLALCVDHLLQLLLELADSLVLQLPSNIVVLDFVRVVLYDFELLLNMHLLLLDLHLRHQFVVLQGDDFLLKLIHLRLQAPDLLVLQMLLRALDLGLPDLDPLAQGEGPSSGQRRRLELSFVRSLHVLKFKGVQLKR